MNTLMTIAAHTGPGYHDGPGAWWPIFPIFWLLVFIAVIAFFATLAPPLGIRLRPVDRPEPSRRAIRCR